MEGEGLDRCLYARRAMRGQPGQRAVGRMASSWCVKRGAQAARVGKSLWFAHGNDSSSRTDSDIGSCSLFRKLDAAVAAYKSNAADSCTVRGADCEMVP